MDRPTPPVAVLVAALALVGFAVAVGVTAGVTTSLASDDTPALATSDHEPPSLSPPPGEVTREEYTQAGIDVSAAAATDAQRLRGHHETEAFEERFETSGNQSTLVETLIDDIGARAGALDEQHAQLLAAYGNGEVSTQHLLRELARIQAAATEHRRLADRIETVVDMSEEVDLSQEIQEQSNALNVEIPALESPVTDALVTGAFEPGTAVYAQATDDAVVLAIPNATHVKRQATLRSERDKNGSNQFFEEAGDDENPNSLALERAEELYGADNVRGFFPPPFDATTVYGIQGNTATSSFVAYLDGATKNVFYEQQQITAADVPVSATLADTAGDLELTVNTTAPTGPMRVSVTEDGEPVEGATLQIANGTVGTTDASGQRWVVQPLGGVEVNVTVEDETLSVTLP